MIIICLRNTGSAFEGQTHIVEDDGWISLYPQGREERPDLFFHARLMASSGSFGAYAVRSYSDEGDGILSGFAAGSPRAWSIPELRADNGPIATRLKATWKDERTQEDLTGSVPKISLLRRMAL